MALGSTQPLTEVSTRCISWDKGGRCVRLTLPPSCAVVMKSGNLNFPEPSGPLQACNGTALPLPLPIFRQSTSTRFERIYSPSSGGTPYIYNNWYLLFLLVDCCPRWVPNQDNRQSTKKHNTYQLLYIYGVPPDDGLQICPKQVEVD